jgi:hypothetical protein
MDSIADLPINDRSMREFLHRFLGSEGTGITFEEARSALVRADSPQPANQQLVVGAQVLFRYRLLDVFAEVLDLPRHSQYREVAQTARPTCSVVHLDRVLFIFIFVFERLNHSCHRRSIPCKIGQRSFKNFAKLIKFMQRGMQTLRWTIFDCLQRRVRQSKSNLVLGFTACGRRINTMSARTTTRLCTIWKSWCSVSGGSVR